LVRDPDGAKAKNADDSRQPPSPASRRGTLGALHDDLKTLTTASNQAEAEEIGERLSKADIRWMPDMDSGVRFGAASKREIRVAAEDYDRAVEVLRTEAPEGPVSVGGAFKIGDRVAHRDQPDAWGTIVAKALTDPVWFFVTDWFPIYLVAKGIELKTGLIAVWIPFVAADLGCFFGGFISGYLIKRGWSLGAARKALIVFGGVGMTMLIPTIFTTNLYLIALLFAIATFTYAGFTTIANTFPSDLFNSESVASVSGMSGAGAGIGTIVAFKLIGYFSDARQATGTHSFDPIVIAAGLIPFVGMILVLLLVRNTRATDQGLVRRI